VHANFVIEDDSPRRNSSNSVCEMITSRLALPGDGEEGQRLAESSAYDLVILI